MTTVLASSVTGIIQTGVRAQITGLVSRPDLNGQWCIIISFDDPTSRYQIEVEDAMQTQLALKAVNLLINESDKTNVVNNAPAATAPATAPTAIGNPAEGSRFQSAADPNSAAPADGFNSLSASSHSADGGNVRATTNQDAVFQINPAIPDNSIVEIPEVTADDTSIPALRHGQSTGFFEKWVGDTQVYEDFPSCTWMCAGTTVWMISLVMMLIFLPRA